MNSIDQQFIEYIVKSLVGSPDEVKVERRIDEKGVLLELTVAQEDLGRVIGKRGATAQSLRTLLRALGTKNEARYNLKIIDVGGPRPPRDDNQAAADDKPDEPAKPKSTASKAKEEAKPEEAEEPPVDKPSDDLDDIQDDEDKADATDSSSDLATRTRAELADLDDLDV
jgi:uncharacterized protein